MKQRLSLITMVAILMVAGFSVQMYGQFKDKGIRFGIAGGFMGGLTTMDNNSLSLETRIFIRHNISDNIDGDLTASLGGVKGNYYQSDLYLGEYKILYKPFEPNVWDPYIGAGLGIAYYSANPNLRSYAKPEDYDGYVGYVPIALGTEYNLTDELQLDVNANFNYALSNNIVSSRTAPKIGTGNDAWWGISVGLSYTISGGIPAAKEAMRVKAEKDALHAREVAIAKARVQDSINAVAARLKEAKAAEALRLQKAAEAKRIQDSINAATQRLPEPKKEAIVPKQEQPKPVAFKTEVGKAIVLEGVVFETGSAIITPASNLILQSAKKTLEENPTMSVEIRGYTDNVGKAKKNLQISQKRAEAVKAWLLKNGIAAKRITAKGYGDKNPIASNKTAEGRQKNRRIEFFRTK